jgi:hypothetical protein
LMQHWQRLKDCIGKDLSGAGLTKSQPFFINKILWQK